MSRLPNLLLLGSCALFAVSVAAAQTAAPPADAPFAVPPFKNLKVLPQDISRADLLSTMKFFTRSLGVRCTYCHVGSENVPLSQYDFAADTKDKKVTARAMVAMVKVLNEQTLPAATGLPDAKVSCFTCHRGSTKPETAPPAAPATAPAPAPAPAPAAAPKSERG